MEGRVSLLNPARGNEGVIIEIAHCRQGPEGLRNGARSSE